MPSRFWKASGNALLPGSNFLTVSAGAWTPASLTGLDLWLDSGDATTKFTDAGTTQATATTDAIQQWNDKSGQGRHLTQATSGARPLNHANGLAFDGVDDALNSSATPVAWNDASGQQVFSFTVTPTNVTATKILAYINQATAILKCLLAWDANGVPQADLFKADGSEVNTETGNAITAGVEVVVTYVVKTTSIEIFVNGASSGSTAFSGALRTDTSQLALGGSQFVGSVRKVVHVSGTVSPSDFTSLHTYMAA